MRAAFSAYSLSLMALMGGMALLAAGFGAPQVSTQMAPIGVQAADALANLRALFF